MKKFRTTHINLDQESDEAIQFFKNIFAQNNMRMSQSEMIRYLVKKVYQEYKKEESL